MKNRRWLARCGLGILVVVLGLSSASVVWAQQEAEPGASDAPPTDGLDGAKAEAGDPGEVEGASNVASTGLGGGSPAPAGGQLTILTDPPGARLAVNESTVGNSPLTLSPLEPGIYQVVATFPNGRAQQVSASVESGQTRTVELKVTAEVKANPTPAPQQTEAQTVAPTPPATTTRQSAPMQSAAPPPDWDGGVAMGSPALFIGGVIVAVLGGATLAVSGAVGPVTEDFPVLDVVGGVVLGVGGIMVVGGLLSWLVGRRMGSAEESGTVLFGEAAPTTQLAGLSASPRGRIQW